MEPESAPEHTLTRITVAGGVPEDPEKLKRLMERIGNAELIAQASEEKQVLHFPLGDQRIPLEHSRVRRGEILLLKVRKYVHKIS